MYSTTLLANLMSTITHPAFNCCTSQWCPSQIIDARHSWLTMLPAADPHQKSLSVTSPRRCCRSNRSWTGCQSWLYRSSYQGLWPWHLTCDSVSRHQLLCWHRAYGISLTISCISKALGLTSLAPSSHNWGFSPWKYLYICLLTPHITIFIRYTFKLLVIKCTIDLCYLSLASRLFTTAFLSS